MLRDFDRFENPYQYLQFILSMDYEHDLLEIRNYLWILDYRLTPFEINNGETDPYLTKDHYTILDRTIYFINLYKTDRNRYYKEKAICDNSTYNTLFPPITEDQIEDILSILEFKHLEPFDILSKPLLGGKILSESIYELELQIETLEPVDTIKQRTQQQATLNKQQYDITFVKKMNQYINEVRSIINNYLESDDEIHNFPNLKSNIDFDHPVGLPMNNGGYKQKVFDSNWNIISTENSQEVSHLNQFYIKRLVSTDPTTGESTYTNITIDDFNTTDQDRINELDNVYHALWIQREDRFNGVGLRGQLESMYNADIPDLKPQLEKQLDSINTIRNQMLKEYGTLT